MGNGNTDDNIRLNALEQPGVKQRIDAFFRENRNSINRLLPKEWYRGPDIYADCDFDKKTRELIDIQVVFEVDLDLPIRPEYRGTYIEAKLYEYFFRYIVEYKHNNDFNDYVQEKPEAGSNPRKLLSWARNEAEGLYRLHGKNLVAVMVKAEEDVKELQAECEKNNIAEMDLLDQEKWINRVFLEKFKENKNISSYADLMVLKERYQEVLGWLKLLVGYRWQNANPGLESVFLEKDVFERSARKVNRAFNADALRLSRADWIQNIENYREVIDAIISEIQVAERQLPANDLYKREKYVLGELIYGLSSKSRVGEKMPILTDKLVEMCIRLDVFKDQIDFERFGQDMHAVGLDMNPGRNEYELAKEKVIEQLFSAGYFYQNDSRDYSKFKFLDRNYIPTEYEDVDLFSLEFLLRNTYDSFRHKSSMHKYIGDLVTCRSIRDVEYEKVVVDYSSSELPGFLDIHGYRKYLKYSLSLKYLEKILSLFERPDIIQLVEKYDKVGDFADFCKLKDRISSGDCQQIDNLVMRFESIVKERNFDRNNEVVVDLMTSDLRDLVRRIRDLYRDYNQVVKLLI